MESGSCVEEGVYGDVTQNGGQQDADDELLGAPERGGKAEVEHVQRGVFQDILAVVVDRDGEDQMRTNPAFGALAGPGGQPSR